MPPAVLLLMLLAQPSPQSRLPEGSKYTKAAEQAQQFIRAVLDGDSQKLAKLGTQPFHFDGRVVGKQEEIAKFWERTLAQHRQELSRQKNIQIEIFDYQTTVRKLGQPPRKLSTLDLKHCLFAAVTFDRRDGLLLILKQTTKRSWRVCAVTD